MTSTLPPSNPSASGYAYLAELALSDYQFARDLVQEDHLDHRRLWQQFAEAGRAALDAMVAALPGPKPFAAGQGSAYDFWSRARDSFGPMLETVPADGWNG